MSFLRDFAFNSCDTFDVWKMFRYAHEYVCGSIHIINISFGYCTFSMRTANRLSLPAIHYRLCTYRFVVVAALQKLQWKWLLSQLKMTVQPIIAIDAGAVAAADYVAANEKEFHRFTWNSIEMRLLTLTHKMKNNDIKKEEVSLRLKVHNVHSKIDIRYCE